MSLRKFLSVALGGAALTGAAALYAQTPNVLAQGDSFRLVCADTTICGQNAARPQPGPAVAGQIVKEMDGDCQGNFPRAR